MNGGMGGLSMALLLVGGLVVASMFVKILFHRTPIPSFVGFLILGIVLASVEKACGRPCGQTVEILHFFGRLGVVALLFRIGLESNLRGLLDRLPAASLIWLVNVLASAAAGYLAMRHILARGFAESMVVAVAFTATSVGISLAVWKDAGALNSKNGEILLDVAELDDISAVVLMGLLFSVLPMLTSGETGGFGLVLGETAAVYLVKLIVFGGACLLFSLYAEERITRYYENMEQPPDRMLMVVGMGFMIAAAADILGFSSAIGAFFAGLVFSRDPDSVKFDASFNPIYEMLTPFFFISVGMRISPAAMGGALGVGLVLFGAAVLGKVVGTGLPAWPLGGGRTAVLLGTSMVPRAEITMVVMTRALAMAGGAVSGTIYGAMILVAALTSTTAPLAARHLLVRWPQGPSGHAGEER
ncbi:MAG: cation:proton antiporter [Desulfatibacillaceae bacterium]